jgi:hypothetical protein
LQYLKTLLQNLQQYNEFLQEKINNIYKILIVY